MLRKWLISTVAVILLAYLLPGIHVAGFLVALLVALVLGVLNTVVRPILILLTIPVTIFTLGLFLLVINVLMVYLTEFLVKGFYVDHFLWALGFSIGLSIVSGMLNFFFGKKD
ncbi:MAG: phage holin family protein [Bacteroidales bacterium]|nr:phage holin family protein [Bacteroidales bacterium]